MGISKSITELVGRTPLLELTNYEKKHNLEAKLVVKLEYFNPNQSVKDRIALNMVEDAEKKGLLSRVTQLWRLQVETQESDLLQ